MSRLCVAMVSDFFYPNIGGVENHIFELSQQLIKHGVKSTFPTALAPFALVRNIFIREQVNIFHGHTSYSTLCHEVLRLAHTMGIRSCITEHSLTETEHSGASAIDYLTEWSVCLVDHAICVSKACKANYIKRTKIDEDKVIVINNAVDTNKFSPRTEQEKQDIYQEKLKIENETGEKIITISILSRLTFRKGAELMVGLIPIICNKYKNVRFFVGGGGVKKIDLENMVSEQKLESRVTLFDNIPHIQARDFLIKGDILLSTSLTEAFGIVLLEGASCGLYVVSTNVDGVPEVLPPHMVTLADPNVDSLVVALSSAIDRFYTIDTSSFHNEILSLYSWSSVAEKTIAVYRDMVQSEFPKTPYLLKKFFRLGWFRGIIFTAHLYLFQLIRSIMNYVYPKREMDIAPSFSFTNRVSRFGELCEQEERQVND